MNLTQENLKPLEVGKTLDLTYAVKWIPTNVTFARRFDIYLDYPFFEHQVADDPPSPLLWCFHIFALELEMLPSIELSKFFTSCGFLITCLCSHTISR